MACEHEPGDPWAAKRHRRAGEPVCQDARLARNAYVNQAKKNRRARGTARPHAGRAEGEPYGAELQEAALLHLKEHPVGLTGFEIARGMGCRDPGGSGAERVLLTLWALHADGRARFVDAPYSDGSRRMTKRWFPA